VSAEVIHGDCLDVLRGMADASVDAVITDPPYSSGGQFRGDRMAKPSLKYVQTGTDTVRPEFGGDNRDQRSYAFWCSWWLNECYRIARPGAAVAVFTDWRQLPTTTDALQAGGFVWRGIYVWDKGEGCRPTRGRFSSQSEFVVWGSKGAMPFERDAPSLAGVKKAPNRQADKFHMTGKPTDLMRHVVQFCERGGLILDPFAGSGSTGVAAVMEGRRFIGVEREAEYVEIARRRIAAAQAQPTLLAPEAA
jgi:site-specific DNA-methyltransferase (adenine-specific)